MDWFLYDNGLRHERVKGEVVGVQFVSWKKNSPTHLTKTFKTDGSFKILYDYRYENS